MPFDINAREQELFFRKKVIAALDELDEPDGGGSVYSILKAKGTSLGAVSFANAEAPITWAAPVIDSGDDISVSGSTITVASDGVYKFTCALMTVSNNRTELILRTYVNGVQDSHETIANYAARDTDQNTGGSVLVTALSLSADDTVQFRGFGDCDGTCLGLDNGTTLLAERVA